MGKGEEIDPTERKVSFRAGTCLSMAQYDQLFSFLGSSTGGIQAGVMPCSEYNRLRRHYEAAIRHWGHVLLSQDAHLMGALTRQAAGVMAARPGSVVRTS
jgi:hypothetical protein